MFPRDFVTCDGIPFSVFLCLLVLLLLLLFVFFKAGNTKGNITGFKSSHVTLPTYEKILLNGQNSFPATCFVKFNWLEYVRRET